MINSCSYHACSKLPAWRNAFPTSLYGCTTDVPCPCLNGGMCLPNNYTSLDEITCSCPANSTGEFCQRCKCTLISQTMLLNSGHACSSLYHSINLYALPYSKCCDKPSFHIRHRAMLSKACTQIVHIYIYQVTPLSNCQVVGGLWLEMDEGYPVSLQISQMLSIIEWGYTRFL